MGMPQYNKMPRKYKYQGSRELSGIEALILRNGTSITKVYEDQVNLDQHAQHYGDCLCEVCTLKKTSHNLSLTHAQHNTHNLLQLFLTCMAQSRNKVVLSIPQVCFFGGLTNGTLWRNNLKSGFIEKQTAFVTERNLYQVFEKHKSECREALGLEWQDTEAEPNGTEINQQEYNRLLPTVKPRVQRLQKTNLVVYRNKEEIGKYHRDTDTPFCVVKYMDGNFQLLNQAQFKMFVRELSISIKSIDYIKSYLNPKSVSDSTIIVDYKASNVDQKVYDEVNGQLSFSLDEVYRLESRYMDPQEYSLEYCQSKLTQEEFLKFKTYEIVIFIEKSCSWKTHSIRIQWMLNEADVYYVYDVLGWQYEDNSWTRKANIDKKAMESCLEDKFPKIFGKREPRSLVLSKTREKTQFGSPKRSLTKAKKYFQQISRTLKVRKPRNHSLLNSPGSHRLQFRLSPLKVSERGDSKRPIQFQRAVDLSSRLFGS